MITLCGLGIIIEGRKLTIPEPLSLNLPNQNLLSIQSKADDERRLAHVHPLEQPGGTDRRLHLL